MAEQDDGPGSGHGVAPNAPSAFAAELRKQAEKIRRLATGRQFEREQYTVAWNDGDVAYYKDPDFLDITYYPLTVERYQHGSTDSDPNVMYYVTDSQDVYHMKYAETDWICDLFEEFTGVTGKDLKPIFNKIKGVPGKLCGDDDWTNADQVKEHDREHADALDRGYGSSATGSDLLLGNAIAGMDDWTGHAAATFATGFERNGEKWKQICKHNYFLAKTIEGGIESLLAIALTTQRDILAIADATKKVLLQVGPERNDFSLSDAQAVFTITQAVFGLAIAPEVEIPALIAAGFTINTNVQALIDSHKPVVPKAAGAGFTITGSTPHQVLDSFKTTVHELMNHTNDKITAVTESLKDANNAIVKNQDRFQVTFDPGAVMFPDHANGDPTSPNLLGKPKDTTVVAEDLVKAVEQFPAATNPIFDANKALAGTAGDEDNVTFGECALTSPRHAMQDWGRLRDLLQDFTAHNGTLIRNAGEVIAKYAKKAGDLDDLTAKDIKAIDKLDDLHATESGHKHTADSRDPSSARPK
ncbi:MAG TPA: hypothetical protein VE172_05740 [Stackebrandtia sp.]|uniref:hypothetical protein n=1 Tax=Stackebrandtia sp. TaxID=2023065 RepID=UPI002D2E8639|nr:hypothetical protein [Stackebrandtia sp.]HZE38296.1 hypothetical protein [Stackebrandtia sp.]